MNLSGFTIVRNARVLDYPFQESVLSILPLCDEFIINCGDSDDDTLDLCLSLEKQAGGKIRLLRSTWEKNIQQGGYQLKYQTDRAIKECQGRWCFYLQADEVIHEDDFPKIQQALERAEKQSEVDGIVFDYVHFYSNYDYFIVGRNWYRREVRLFKNGRGIEAFRDAQGFRKQGKRIHALSSAARVFHYGYVRSVESMAKKAEQMALWWGNSPETEFERLKPKRHVGLHRFSSTHPGVMRDRVARNASYIDPLQCQRKWDRNEIKNALTLVWESVFPYRIGEFRNYELV